MNNGPEVKQPFITKQQQRQKQQSDMTNNEPKIRQPLIIQHQNTKTK